MLNKVAAGEADAGLVYTTDARAAAGEVEAIELPPDYSITDFAVPPAWFDRSIRELEIRAKHGVTVLSIHRGEDRYLNPAPDFVLQSGDIAVLLGETGETKRLRELYS